MIDIHFCAYNRRTYTDCSLSTLAENTDWSLVNHLYITDDNSTDGTSEYLLDVFRYLPVQATLLRNPFGGPVAAMNAVLDRTNAEIFAKVDSDLILPPGWLDTMLTVMEEYPELDALGTEPGFAPPLQPPDIARGYKPGPHIGGQGLFRTRAFRRRRPQQHNTFFGLTEFQKRYMTAGWIDPDIASFNLDHLPCDPWRSLAADYVANGWSRAWSSYDLSFRDYWIWWTAAQVAA